VASRTALPPKKIGNAHLRWAFGEAACVFLEMDLIDFPAMSC
jgi:hypothetical protein